MKKREKMLFHLAFPVFPPAAARLAARSEWPAVFCKFCCWRCQHCATHWPTVACSRLRLALRNWPSWLAERPVLQRKTGRFALRNGSRLACESLLSRCFKAVARVSRQHPSGGSGSMRAAYLARLA